MSGPGCITEYRCEACHKLLFKGLLVESTIEIKCKSCHHLTTIHAHQFNELLCLIKHCPNRVAWDSLDSSS